MTKYVDFFKEGKFFGEDNEPLNVEAFERYKSKYGNDRAEGYYEAVKDFSNEIGFILGCYNGQGLHEGATHYTTPHVVKAYIEKLYNHNITFLNRIYKVESKTGNDPDLKP